MSALTKGADHIGLTVPDVTAAASFFIDVLGFSKVGERPDYPAIFVSDGVTWLTLWQVGDKTRAAGFDRKTNIGLHHLALRVEPSALDAVYEKLKATPGVRIEFAPEPLRGGPTRHMMCIIPAGIRFEFIAPAT